MDRPTYTLAAEEELREQIAAGRLDAAEISMLAADARTLAARGDEVLSLAYQLQALQFAVDVLRYLIHNPRPKRQLGIDLEPVLFGGES